jgi:hypothetical protein
MADVYPEVPPPDAPFSPILLAARWTSHDLYGEEMPEIAANLLGAGFDTPALRQLAGEILINNTADAEPLVGRMFSELGVSYPLQEREANLIITRQIAREVIAGSRNAWAAASHLEIVIWDWTAGNSDLDLMFSINDEVNWDASYRRSISALNDSLLSVFARLSVMT